MGLPSPQWSHSGHAVGSYEALGARQAAGKTAAGAEAGAKVETEAGAKVKTETETDVEAEAGEGGELSALHHQQAPLATALPTAPQAPRPTLNLSPRSHYTLLQDGVRAHLFPFPKTHTNTRRTRRAAAAAARTPTHTHPPTNPLTHQPAHSHPSSPSPHPHPTPIHQLRTRVANNAFKRRRA